WPNWDRWSRWTSTRPGQPSWSARPDRRPPGCSPPGRWPTRPGAGCWPSIWPTGATATTGGPRPTDSSPTTRCGCPWPDSSAVRPEHLVGRSGDGGPGGPVRGAGRNLAGPAALHDPPHGHTGTTDDAAGQTPQGVL